MDSLNKNIKKEAFLWLQGIFQGLVALVLFICTAAFCDPYTDRGGMLYALAGILLCGFVLALPYICSDMRQAVRAAGSKKQVR